MQHTIQNLQATKGSESDKAFENSKVVDSASHGNETFETKTSFEKPKDSPQTSGQQTINGEVF